MIFTSHSALKESRLFMWNGNSMVAADLKLGNEEFPVRFVVPIYQRVFTWGEREVGRLLSDLYDHFVKES